MGKTSQLVPPGGARTRVVLNAAQSRCRLKEIINLCLSKLVSMARAKVSPIVCLETAAETLTGPFFFFFSCFAFSHVFVVDILHMKESACDNIDSWQFIHGKGAPCVPVLTGSTKIPYFVSHLSECAVATRLSSCTLWSGGAPLVEAGGRGCVVVTRGDSVREVRGLSPTQEIVF